MLSRLVALGREDSSNNSAPASQLLLDVVLKVGWARHDMDRAVDLREIFRPRFLSGANFLGVCRMILPPNPPSPLLPITPPRF